MKDRNGEGRGLASTGLGLSDDIVTLDDRDDRALLDGGGALETKGEKTSEIIDSYNTKRTRKRRYRGEVLASDPYYRNFVGNDPSAIPEVERRIKNTNLSTISSQLDSISPSGIS